ncbi:MAG: hypothetical protein ABID54_08410 [Pseudomonadota bacterium]
MKNPSVATITDVFSQDRAPLDRGILLGYYLISALSHSDADPQLDAATKYPRRLIQLPKSMKREAGEDGHHRTRYLY